MKKNKIAVFDIDDTIFRETLIVALMKSLIYRKIFPQKAKKEVEDEYFAWINKKGTYQKYINEVLRVYRKYIKGCKQKDIIKVAKQDVIPYFKDRVYLFTRDLVKKLRKSHLLISISGSPQETVTEYNRYLKFDQAFGSIFEVGRDGRYSGKFLLDVGKKKAKILKDFIKQNNLSLKDSFGVGDSQVDISFLKLVEHPIVFNPSVGLYKLAKRKKWKIVVEKKDTIYQIQNGK
jgi:HAD superfamily hydrolase (TIGR01490 family)